MMLSAKLTIADFNQQLQNIMWKGEDASRSTIRFGYLMWPSLSQREMVKDIENEHVYSPVAVGSWMDPPSGYPYHRSAATICNSFGMYPLEINNVEENTIVNRTFLYGPMLMGEMQHNTLCTSIWFSSTLSPANYTSNLNYCNDCSIR